LWRPPPISTLCILPVGFAVIKRLPALLAEHEAPPPRLVSVLRRQHEHFKYLDAQLGTSKRGDKNIRRLLVQCARVFMQHVDKDAGRKNTPGDRVRRGVFGACGRSGSRLT